MIMTNKQFLYECDDETLQQLQNLTGGKRIYRKEFQHIVTTLINKANEKCMQKRRSLV